MRSIQEPIQVTTNNRSPVQIIWRGKTYQVQSISERWRWKQLWWIEEQTRSYYRCTTRAVHGGGTVEMEVYDAGEAWMLTKVYD